VYKLARRGSSWILTPLYTFTGGSDGAIPLARAPDQDGWKRRSMKVRIRAAHRVRQGV
jgi:hypothetical protein